MVEMHVEGLSLDPQTRKPIVILRQNDGKGLLPLWIGAMEAMTISLVLNGEELPRPLAHDLLLMVAKALNGTLTGVDIVDYRDDIYYAVLLLRGPSGLISVDCRPSDGIALALRASVPIRVKTEVFEKAAREQEHPSRHPAPGRFRCRHRHGPHRRRPQGSRHPGRPAGQRRRARRSGRGRRAGTAARPFAGPGARIAEQDVESIVPGGLCCNTFRDLNESR